MARRYINPKVQAAGHRHEVEHEHSAGRVDVFDEHSGIVPAHRFIFGPGEQPPEEPAAAKLDGYPWARSLGAFLAAIGGEGDPAGAKAVIRAVMHENRPRAAAGMSERIPAEGGFLVPQRLAEQIESFMTGAVIVPRSVPVPMDSLRVPVPVLDAPNQSGGVLGGLVFAMVAESAAITPSTPNFGVLALEARKFAAYLQAVPNELCDDSPVFTDLFLPRIVAQGLAWSEDNLAVNGTGVGEPQGLLNAPAALTQVRTTSDTVGVADITGMMKQLHPQSKRSRDTIWLLGDDLFGVLLELATLTGSPTSGVSAPQVWLEYDAQAGFWRLLGYPAFPTDWQPALGSTGDAILVDLSLYLWGTRGEMTIERSAKGSGFISNTSNFRFRHRVDGRFWPQSSYTLSNSQVVSPLVILAEAS